MYEFLSVWKLAWGYALSLALDTGLTAPCCEMLHRAVVSMVMNPIIPPVVENIWSTWALLNEKGVFHIVLIVCQSTVCEFNLPALVIRPISDVNKSISVCTVLCCTCSAERAARQTFTPYSYHYVEFPWPLEWCANTLVELLDTLGIPVVSIFFFIFNYICKLEFIYLSVIFSLQFYL